MKILIISQYFWPETFRINDLAVELQNRGYQVEVLTGKPNYPKGKFYLGYSFFGRNKEIYNLIKIYRVPIIPRGSGRGIRIFLNYLSFIISSSLFVIFSRKRYDVTFVFGVSPITQALPSILHKKLYRSKSYLWLQDLWPESVTEAGNIDSKIILGMLSKMVKYIYHRVDRILISSEAFSDSILSKGIRSEKISYLPNWADDIFIEGMNIDVFKHSKIIPKGFVVMFAGNIGEAQDFESIVKAAELTKHIPDIKWVIIGDGRKRKWLEVEIASRELSKTFYLLGRYPSEDMPSFFIHADVTLVTLKNSEIFGLTIPSKFQSYMAFGKPILSMLNGIGSKIIIDANCGYTASASDFKLLAENVLKAYALPKYKLDEMGINAKKYYHMFFAKAMVIDKLESQFKVTSSS